MKLNTNQRRVPMRFDRQTRFKLKPRFALWSDAQAQSAFEHLKVRLMTPVLDEASDPDLQRQLRLAANEAAAVAWTTPYPLLILPVLLQEKAAEAHQYVLRREQVQDATQLFMT